MYTAFTNPDCTAYPSVPRLYKTGFPSIQEALDWVRRELRGLLPVDPNALRFTRHHRDAPHDGFLWQPDTPAIHPIIDDEHIVATIAKD